MRSAFGCERAREDRRLEGGSYEVNEDVGKITKENLRLEAVLLRIPNLEPDENGKKAISKRLFDTTESARQESERTLAFSVQRGWPN
jgi:hypothetical protein